MAPEEQTQGSDAPTTSQPPTTTPSLEQLYPSARILTESDRKGWTSFRKHLGDLESVEVLVSPFGHWYKRAGKGEQPDLVAPSKTQGIGPALLVNIDHWKPVDPPQVASTEAVTS